MITKYKKILITCFGLPNNFSEQSNNDPLLFANFFKKKGFNVQFLCISNTISNTENENNLELFKNLNKKFKTTLIKINYNKLNNLIQKVKIILSKDKVNFNISDNDNKKIRDSIYKINPDLIFNFSEHTLAVIYKTNFKTINYVFLDREKIEKIKIKQFLENFTIKNIFNIVNSLLYLFSYLKIRNKIYSFPIINIYPGEDPPKFLNKKNLIISKPLTNNDNIKKKIKKTKSNKIKILMVGNNRSTFVIDGLINFSKNLINTFCELHKKNNIEINIVGKFLPPKKILEKINFRWIKLYGWVKNIDDFFNNCYILLVPNRISLGVRTKILDAMRHGLPVLCYSSSNFKGSGFVNSKNILMAKDHHQMKENIIKIINNPFLAQKISKNSKILFKKRYKNDNNIKKTLNKIFKII